MRRPLGGLGMRKKIKHEIEDLDNRIRILLWERYGDVLSEFMASFSLEGIIGKEAK